MMCGIVLWVLGIFLWVYGGKSFRNALFSLLFLVFIIPFPTLILDAVVEALRIGSAFFWHAALEQYR